MIGQIDSSFQTSQRDMFESGVVAEIGVNAYAVWAAIKHHANYSTGEAWPGMRRLGELVGLSKSSIDRAIDVLVAAKLLRIEKPAGRRRGQTYIARERMAVRIGGTVVCTIVIDYVPSRLHETLGQVKEMLGSSRPSKALVGVEIIPGDGFVWDPKKNALTGLVEAPEPPPASQDEERFRQIGEKLLSRAVRPLRG